MYKTFPGGSSRGLCDVRLNEKSVINSVLHDNVTCVMWIVNVHSEVNVPKRIIWSDATEALLIS